MEDNEFASLFHLDQHRLDEEWLAQPGLYFDYAMKLADAKETYEQAKANRDLVELRTKPKT